MSGLPVLSSSHVTLGAWVERRQQLRDVSAVLWTNMAVPVVAEFRYPLSWVDGTAAVFAPGCVVGPRSELAWVVALPGGWRTGVSAGGAGFQPITETAVSRPLPAVSVLSPRGPCLENRIRPRTEIHLQV